MTEAQALSAFVAGTISFSALRNAIAESTQFVFQPSGTIQITSTRKLPKTSFAVGDVARVLERYVAGEVTKEELTTWGLVVHNLNAFEFENSSEIQREAIWDIVGELSVASVNSAFDAGHAAELRERLQVLDGSH